MPPDETTWKQFAEKLDLHHTWPGLFVFKCVVPSKQMDTTRALLPEGEISTRESKNGKFTSLTCTFTAVDAAVVVAVYRRLAAVEGILLL